jgi:hypothetical protein
MKYCARTNEPLQLPSAPIPQKTLDRERILKSDLELLNKPRLKQPQITWVYEFLSQIRGAFSLPHQNPGGPFFQTCLWDTLPRWARDPLRPPHPGIRRASLSIRPSRKAAITSSIEPQIWGMMRTPAEARAACWICEIIPQIRRSTPSFGRRRARSKGFCDTRDSSWRCRSCLLEISTIRMRLASSKTGETRPCHNGIATFISWPV